MFKIQYRKSLAIALAAAAAYVALAFTVQDSYIQHVLTMVAIYAALGLSWNVLGGYAGAVSFGHAAFFGLGAFTVTLLLKFYDITPWIGLPLGVVVGAVAGAAIGFPTFRLRGVFFAQAMLAYPLVLRIVFDWLGLQEVSIPRKLESAAYYMQFSDPRAYTLLAVLLVALCVLISIHVEHSRLGLSLTATKQNEQAAEAAGIDTWRGKMIAITLSGGMAAAAGGLFSIVLLVTTPESVFGLMQSAQAMVVTLFGGVGTVWGPLIGASVLIPLGEGLHLLVGDRLPGIQGIVYGLAMVAVILMAPEGLFWSARDRLFRGRRRQSEPSGSSLMHSSHDENSIADPEPKKGAGSDPVDRAVVLRVEGISKSFGGVKAVNNVSFDVRQGTILGIIGQNGAGKTTVFNLLNGFVVPDQGSIMVGERSLIGLKPNQVARLGVGRTFQVVRPFPRMSVLENVVVGAFVSDRNDQDAHASARDALRRVGLLGKANVLAGQLNNLDLRLMELARALASRPKVLLLDETLAGLSHPEVEEMLAVIRRVPDDETAVVIIEHTMHAMLRLSDVFLVLDHGCVIASGEPNRVVQEPAVIEAYLGKKWMAENAVA